MLVDLSGAGADPIGVGRASSCGNLEFHFFFIRITSKTY